MVTTVFIDHDDHVIDYYVNDAPTATVKGDFLIGLERSASMERVRLSTDEGRCVFLSHESSIAESVRNTSIKVLYFRFFRGGFFENS